MERMVNDRVDDSDKRQPGRLRTSVQAAPELEQLGLAVRLLGMTPSRGGATIRDLDMRLRPAIHLNQIRFAFDSDGAPIGYWTWALLAPDVERRLCADPACWLDDSDWNEGGRCWIMDFVAPLGHVDDMVRYMGRFFAAHGDVCYLARRAAAPAMVRRVLRQRRPAPPGLKARLQDLDFAGSRQEWLANELTRDRSGMI